jgi:hypothetical protein
VRESIVCSKILPPLLIEAEIFVARFEEKPPPE